LKPFAALLAALALAFAALGLTAAPANAHAVLVASSPIDGARVDSPPSAVTLTFDESVRLIPAAAQVISATGLRADNGTAHLSADGTTIVIPLRPDLPRGSYAATWRVVSADTHVVSGSISFGIGQDAGAPVPTSPEHAAPLTLTADVARGVLYVGLVLCTGLALVCRSLWPWAFRLARIRALLVGGWISIAVATAGQFLLQGPQSLNLGWAAVFSRDAISDTLTSRSGAILIARAVVIVVLGAALRSGRRGSTVTLALCAAGIAVTVVIDGHAGVGAQAWLATAVTSVHVLAMTVWLGGLIAICVAVLPSRRVDNLRRWSLTAFACVSTLILSGEYQAWRQVRPVEAMWSTGYGITLSVKLAIVAAMLAVAYVGQRRLDPKVLRRSVPVEMTLGLAVVAVTTALVSQAPARTTFGPPVTVRAPLDSRSALITVGTTRRGPTDISVTALDAAGHQVRATSVTGTLSSEDAGIAALNVTFQPATDGQWRSAHAVVPLPGSWTLKLVVEFSTSDAVATAAHFPVW
jgi:copper transport protein